MATTRSRPQRRTHRAGAGWPQSLTVEGLFREDVKRRIEFRLPDHVTILSGPNGSGKTRLLVILRAALALDWNALASEPFRNMNLTYSTGKRLVVHRRQKDEGLYLQVEVLQRTKPLTEVTMELQSSAAPLHLPGWIAQVDDELWQDLRDGELLDRDDLTVRFGPGPGHDPRAGPWQLASSQARSVGVIREAIGHSPPPTLIETKRLDVRSRREARRSSNEASRHERIHDYVNEIQRQVQAARAEYSMIAQRADSQFASRALEKSSDSPPALPELRRRFQELAELHGELLKTGLAAETPGVEMRGGSLTKAERRIFSVFLEDWGRKLAPLLPVHEKLQMLQEIVGAKLKDKHLRLDSNAHLRVENIDGAEIPVDQLSSGEQHLLALFAMLLFSASPSSVVLIDEPEISLHAEWKHAFLDDIQKAARNADLQFVLATHSTAIINGQWDLVEEL